MNGGQAVLVMDDEFNSLPLFKDQCEMLRKILPAETLSGSKASKDNVIKLVSSRSAPLVHFLVHGTSQGRAGRRLCKRKLT